MEEDRAFTYYETIHSAIRSKNISDLAILYKSSPRMKAYGEVARHLINNEIPSLAEYYGVAIKSGIKFLQFSREYRSQVLGIKPGIRERTLYISKYNLPSDVEMLFKSIEPTFSASKHGGKRTVPYPTPKVETRPILVIRLTDAARDGDLEEVKEVYSKIQKELADRGSYDIPTRGTVELQSAASDAFLAAVIAGSIPVTEFFLKKGVQSSSSMYRAAKNDDREMIRLLIKYGNKDWQQGQSGANEGGHLELRRLFSRKLAGMNAEF